MPRPPLPRRRFLTGLPAIGLLPGARPAPLSAASALSSLEPLRDVVFGSCLDTHEHPMLDRAAGLPRDLFIFMGDNIYADKGGVPMMREKYALLKQSAFFQALRSKGSVLATWDDHDFGENDGGSSYRFKKEAQAEFWNWLDEPAASPRRQREGVHQAALFGPEGRRTQVILLDTRYFRGPLRQVPKEEALLGGRHGELDDPAVTMLGEAQWSWLEETLRVPADLRLVVSSIQFAPELHGGECWANLPRERQRMLDVLGRTKASGVIFLSGDRHWCEFSRIAGPAGYPLHDYTSSSLTQKHPRGTPTVNRHRFLPRTYHLPNVGHLHIDWDHGTLETRIVSEDGATQLAHSLGLDELRAR